MSSISGISGSSAWSNMSAMRGNRPPGGMDPARMYAKVDTDSSGGVDQTELQAMLDDVSQKTGATFDNAKQLFSDMDSDGDGTLSQNELGDGMKNIIPPPSTMAFAQSRSAGGQDGSDDLFSKVDGNGDGSVSKDELLALLDQMEAAHGVATDDTDHFSQLDTDGDGQLSQTEFEAGRPQGGQGPQGAGGMPPPPPPGGMGANSGASTSYDPLDTNEDGTVSAAERAAGAAGNDAVQALFQAIDTDGDRTISNTESDAFVQALMAQTDAATSTQGTESGADSSQSAFAQLVSRAYQQIAGSLSRTSQANGLHALA